MRHLLANGSQAGSNLFRRVFAQIHHRDVVLRHLMKNLLPAIWQHDRPEHAVAINHSSPCLLKAMQVQVGAFKFKINMGCDIAKFKSTASTNPISLLNIGEREGVVEMLSVRHNRWQ